MPELDRDPEALAACADDWGHMVSRTPRAVARPSSVDEVVATVRAAREEGVPVVARGRGHAMAGDAQVEDGIVIDMSRLDRAEAVEGDSVWVEAGASWQDLFEAVYPEGMAPRVVPHYPKLSIGGVLCGAGVGIASVRHGLATDTVTEMDVVTGEGEVLRCSAQERPDLFEAVRGGLGQTAIIVRARIVVEPVPERLVETVLTYGDLEVFFDALRRAAAHPETWGLLGMVGMDEAGRPVGALYADLPGGPESDTAVAHLAEALPPPVTGPDSYELTYLEHFGAMAAVEERYRTTTDYWDRLHPWFGVILSPGEIAGYLEEHLADIVESEGRGRLGNAVVYVIGGRAEGAGGAPLPEGDPVFGFSDNGGFPATPENATWAGERNRRLYEAARRRGGTLGPFGYMPMEAPDWEAHFGDRWADLVEAKRRYDPDGVLARDLSR